jgi:hypothetical protein
MITIVRAVQTCQACPSQWDAWDADGNYYYLRYRSGCGSVTQYKSENWAGAPWVENPDESRPGWAKRANTEFIADIAEFVHGDPLDGSITLEEFAALAGMSLSDGIQRTAFWRHTKNQLTEEFAGDEVALARVDEVLGSVNLDEE